MPPESSMLVEQCEHSKTQSAHTAEPKAAKASTESGAREVEARRRCSAWKARMAAARTVAASKVADDWASEV